MLTNNEKKIIDDDVLASLCFGTAVFRYAKEAITELGYTWTEEHERYTFDAIRRIEDATRTHVS